MTERNERLRELVRTLRGWHSIAVGDGDHVKADIYEDVGKRLRAALDGPETLTDAHGGMLVVRYDGDGVSIWVNDVRYAPVPDAPTERRPVEEIAYELWSELLTRDRAAALCDDREDVQTITDALQAERDRAPTEQETK